MQPTLPQLISQAVATATIANRLRHPHAVSQPGLLPLHLGYNRFHARLAERRRWIAQNCRSSFFVDDLLNDDARPIGKLYCFEDMHEAVWFRMRF
jgi:hypothetical protein